MDPRSGSGMTWRSGMIGEGCTFIGFKFDYYVRDRIYGYFVLCRIVSFGAIRLVVLAFVVFQEA